MAVVLDVSHRDARGRVAEPAVALNAEQLRTPVPATPGWTVHELLSHLVGVAADAASGRLDGAPGEKWTARHVGELFSEWQRVSPTVESDLTGRHFSGPGPAPDLICHEADLREALGLSRVDREHWQQPFLEVTMLVLGKRLQHTTTVLVRDEHGRE